MNCLILPIRIRREVLLPLVAALVCFSTATTRITAQVAGPNIAIQAELLPDQTHLGVEVTGLSAEHLELLAQWQADQKMPAGILELFVDGQATPVLGNLVVGGFRLILAPRFELRPATAFIARFHFEKLQSSSLPVELRFTTPPSGKPVVAARLTDVYPSSDRLPQNVLRMYLKFATPMARGRAYDHVGFVDEEGNAIDEAYIRIEQELWNPDGTRLTILFDPGRIKRGLVRNQELGTPFQLDQTITLVVDAGWPDASGSLLEQEFRKSFRVIDSERTQPAIKHWKLELPPAGSREPLLVRFDRPFDYAQLQHSVQITNGSSTPVTGSLAIGDGETSVSFVPDEDWVSGEYCLAVDPQLEDRSGNSLEKPFEVDFESLPAIEPPVTTRVFSIR